MSQTPKPPAIISVLVGGLVLALIFILFVGVIIRAAKWAF